MIQCGEQLQPLLNLMRDRLLDYPMLHCDETRLQVLHEPGRDPTVIPLPTASGIEDYEALLPWNCPATRAP